MQRSRLQSQILVAVVIAAILSAAGVGWRLCQYENRIAFLPVKIGSQWILDPTPPDMAAHPTTPIKNVFQRRFILSTLPNKATLTVCAFKNADVFLNGQEIARNQGNEKDWKTPETTVITDRLRAGTNELVIWVTNNAGPPALWLRLQAGNFSLSSDADWQVSLLGNTWTQAHPAARPIPLPRWSPMFDNISTLEAVENQWRNLALFLAIALGTVFFIHRRPAMNSVFNLKLSPVYILLTVILLGRAALLIHDVARLPDWIGFDQPSHLAYIQFVQQNGTLPPLDGGAEMHQPPLYYLISAAAMKLGGFAAGKANTVIALRVVNGIWGLINCWVALLCLRRLFPNEFSTQAVGLLIASLLPSYLYLSFGITNDPLAGLLVTLAFYFLLRALQSEQENRWPYVGIGLSLGAAMLTKLSVLPAVPVFFIVLAWRLMERKNQSTRLWLRNVGTVAGLCVIVCGWHYFRIWSHTGSIALPQSEGNSWWQSPGFRTASYYLSFGRVLVSPLFSGLSSFADGIYATFWGDGMLSGATGLIFRSPWNYDLMKAGYLLALPLTLLGSVGIAVAIRRGHCDRQPEWFFVTGMIFIYALALAFISLIGPWQSQVKAFYAIPAFLPACAVIALGWNWLAKKNRTWQALLWVLILLWSLTTYTTFWITPREAEFWRSRAMVELRNQHSQAAIDDAKQALSLNPDDFETHCLLANAYTAGKNPAAAIEQYGEALRINPEAPQILDIFAQMQLDGDKDTNQRAVQLAEQACQLTRYRNDSFLTTLAAAYANAGQTEKAMVMAENASELAAQNGNAALLKQNQELIERCRKAKGE